MVSHCFFIYLRVGMNPADVVKSNVQGVTRRRSKNAGGDAARRGVFDFYAQLFQHKGPNHSQTVTS